MAHKYGDHLEVDAIELAPVSDRTSRSYEPRESYGFRPSDVDFDEKQLNHPAQNEDLVRRPVRPVDVVVRDLSVVFRPKAQVRWLPWGLNRRRKLSDVETQPPANAKTILDNLSADMAANTLTAILGSSGSGKTTLLNTIAHRVNSRKLAVSGLTSYGGTTFNNTTSAYVMQQDLLLPTLTVRETLQYAADLRLPSLSNAKERRAIVESVILELGLKECANTRIGSSIHKGCSGGEKRRVSIGVQMLANPSVLYCDEPTTGLDAYSAYQVVQTLKRLAQHGRTVIISIHTPRSEIAALFDNVILLSAGTALYSGPAAAALPHFARCGHVMPPFSNPAEFMIDLAAVDNRDPELERISLARTQHLRQAWQEVSKTTDHVAQKHIVLTVEEPTDMPRPKSVGFLRQVLVLTRRGIRVAIRDPLSVASMILEAIIMSFVSGWIFYQLPKDLAGIKSRQGALFSAFALQSYLLLLIEIYRLTSEYRLFDLEHVEGAVSVPAFLLSRRLSRLFLEDLPMPLVFSLIYYFMVGFRAEPATFFIFLFLMILAQYVTMTFASLCVALSRDYAGASLFANLLYTVNSFACGFFVNANQIPVYTRWLKWVAPNFYLLGAFLSNEFIGVDSGPLGQLYDCPLDDPSDSRCASYSGRSIMQNLAFPTNNWIWRPAGVVVGFSILWWVLAGLVLQSYKVNMDVATVRKPEKPDTAETMLKEDIPETSEIVPVSIGLQNYSLEVQVKNILKKSTTKTILQNVSASFTPSHVNVIMGPSGSGKTSLLQSIACRLHGGTTSKYKSTGAITLNNAVPTRDVLASVTSFVTQDDDALMPSLTVRETLHFAAKLRLPASMSKQEKVRRAEEVLLKMGLKDCADRLIGSDLKKSTSGGERRRVSIAVQILTDPKVLLLDEPTSGLDAFLASSVITVLKSLANEGRTIIMTIHQARSQLIDDFDNILLLARGGSLAYTGPTREMLSYFSKHGFECPTSTNPADFVLDLITVDLQEESKETASRERVQRIIERWKVEETSKVDVQTRTQIIASPAELNSLKREQNPVWIVFPLLLQRSIINTKRNFEIIMARTMQVIGYGIILALFFAPLKNNYEGIQSRMGFLQEVTPLYFIGMLQNLAVYPTAQRIFLREHADGCYTAPTFLASYTLLELPFTALSSLLFGLISAYAIRAKQTAGFAFAMALNCFCIVTTGESIGIIFVTLFDAVGDDKGGLSVNLMSTVISISVTMAGIFSLDMPAWLRALNWLSPLKYAVANMTVLMLRGQRFSCEGPGQRGTDGECVLGTGEEVLRLYGLVSEPGVMLAALVGSMVVYRGLAFGVLWVVKR